MTSNLNQDGDSYFYGDWNAQAITVSICSAVSMYNGLELLVWIAVTFQKMHGLYFWSLLAATAALIPYTVGFILSYYRITYQAVGMAFSGVGWMMMITGQSLVLYSRLGLILHHDSILKAVKWMIIFDAITLHTTTEVLNFCGQYGPHQATCGTGYRYFEKVQMTWFCVQEFIISGLYIWQTVKLLNVVSKEGTRKVMWELFCINVFIVCLDIGLLVVEYLNYHAMEQTVKGFVYSVKLKLEFLILGKLVDLVHSANRNLSSAFADTGGFLHQENGDSDLKGRKKSVDVVPEWMQELEKISSDHVEHAPPIPSANGHPVRATALDKPDHLLNGDVNGEMSELQRRRTAESDYAHALRSIST